MVELTIGSLGHLGDGVVHWNGQDIFVPFTLPGEQIEGEISGNRIEKPRIVTPSVDRIKPACRHFKSCGGCVAQHARDTVLADWKVQQVKDTLAMTGLETVFRPIVTSPPHSRRRATFAGRRSKSGTVLGFHQRGSTALIDLQQCALITPQLWASGDGLRALIVLGASRKGEVRLTVTETLNGADVDVLDAKPLTPQQVAELGQIAITHKFARVTWNGDVLVQLSPPHQAMGRARVVPPPGAFLQATEDGEHALLLAVKEAVGDAARIADLFCGCGTFALPLSEHAQVLAVEGDPEMTDAMLLGWREAGGLHKLEGISRDLFRRPLLPAEFKGIDAVVIDPPRAGAQAQVTEIAKSEVRRIGFVSCNPTTFARDAKILVDAGYQLNWVQVVDQFRWSSHVELVAQFTRDG